jgi:protein-L-isoaspartate(D-aspartate) O-methyltransferase
LAVEQIYNTKGDTPLIMMGEAMRHGMRNFTPPHGDDEGALALARRSMVEHDLAARGIRSPRVLEVMGRVPRERFVAAGAAGQAYEDRALGIACEQTISQPYMVALMTEALEVLPHHRVLEIGTGSGYQAAVLAELAQCVVTVERHEQLSRTSHRILNELGYKNIEFVVGDGTLGFPPRAPYDRIIVTAAGEELPPALWSQLAEGGRIVAPLGPRDEQWLTVISKCHGRREEHTLTACRFVPLVGSRANLPPETNRNG